MINKNKNIRDIVIVGAGPAGCSAAYFLAKLGLDVLLLDSKKFPRSKPCGDGTGPRAVKILHQMKLGSWLKENNFYRIDMMRIISSSSRFIISETSGYDFPFPYGYVIRRDIFDEQLVRHAVAAGAELRENFHVTSYLKQDGRITGITSGCQGEKIEILARLV
ncbi:MAG TPA: FAD-dependent oxidoreductase, partial [Actinobacteria bacterium]|nr:FAD-dependent oxidoreductase [Actinomycetes bacterium]HEX21021.1 FAD-dependent oxidoreductase [Actinomycetota bacterium]